jgi:hypothetical protein
MKSFKNFQEDIEISGNKYNDMVSKRQIRDKRKERSDVDTQFNKSDKLERVKMNKTRRKVYSEDLATEVYDPEVQGRSQITKTGEGGRVGRDRKKSEPEKRRMKAIGGGKAAPVDYKDRKDIGTQRSKETRQQAPQQERGSSEVKQSYADKVKAERRAAAQARAAAKKGGGEVKKTTTSKKETEKQATKLLSTKKSEKKVSPDYKPQKASGYTRQERMKIHRKGETIVRNAFKDQETAKYKKETGVNPDSLGKKKILSRVHKRMV